MRKLTSSIYAPLLALCVIVMAACDSGSGGGGPKEPKTDPTNPNEISKVLVIPGSTTKQGNMPAPSGTPDAPDLAMVDSTVAYSAGGQVKLPINYNDNSGTGVSGIYAQVVGSNQHFQVAASGAGSSGTLVLPIGIPTNVADGKFCVTISIYDNDGNVSQQFTTCVTVTPSLGCGIQRVSGGEGITSTIHNMGNKSGIVKIKYETYTVPDRIDVFYGGQWVAGTGSSPGPAGSVPPLANCSNPTDGYVGQAGEFIFPFVPTTSGTNVEVVVSGCVRGGTAWKYDISCAEEAGIGQATGSFSIGSYSVTSAQVVCISQQGSGNYQIGGVTSNGASQLNVVFASTPSPGTYSVIEFAGELTAGTAYIMAMDGRVMTAPVQYWSTGGGQVTVTNVGGKLKVTLSGVPVEHYIDETPSTVSASLQCG